MLPWNGKVLFIIDAADHIPSFELNEIMSGQTIATFNFGPMTYRLPMLIVL